MSFDAITYNVMIASPGDVATERNVARDVIAEWNAMHAASRRVVLLPVGWETHAAPTMGMQAQEVINRQVLRTADLLIGIFWTRIGTATVSYASGTVEEIEEHIKANKPAMLYFSETPVQADLVVARQYEQLREFRESLRSRGLYDTFSSPGDFRDKFRRQLQLKLNDDSYFVAREPTVETLANDLAVRLQSMIDRFLTTAHTQVEEAQHNVAIARHAQLAAESVAQARLQDLMTMTHQIQGPLIGVVGALSGITGKTVDRLDKELIEHARALVEDAITVSYGTFTTFALAAGRATAFVEQEIDAVAEVKKLVKRIQRTNPRPEVSFAFRSQQGFPPLRFDPRVFPSVLYNLIHNAVKYADDSTEIVVECGYERDGEPVIKVKSIGAPILLGERELIFERFRRGASVERGRIYTGVGLGLWVARELMRASGGDITVELSAQHPRLSVFVVHFPPEKASRNT